MRRQMLTTDLALRVDPAYEAISRRFLAEPDGFADAFARAWFKLTHRDMGPIARYVGKDVPPRNCCGRTRCPRRRTRRIDAADIATLKQHIADSGLTVAQLVSTAWASASSYRHSDKRGGANGARIRLEPQRSWAVNEPAALATVLSTLEGIAATFNGSAGGKAVSLADLIVLAGGVGIEHGGEGGGRTTSPCRSRRAGSMQRRSRPTSPRSPIWTSAPTASATIAAPTRACRASICSIDRANLLGLSAPEMTVLLGGLRALGVTHKGTKQGVLTDRPGRADERLLRQPARAGRDVAAARPRVGDVRGDRRRPRQVDRHARRPRVRLELRTARARRGLCRERREPSASSPASSPRGSR